MGVCSTRQSVGCLRVVEVVMRGAGVLKCWEAMLELTVHPTPDS